MEPLNAFSSMDVTVSGRTSVLRFAHLLNAPYSITSRCCGIFTVLSDEQPVNAPAPITVTASGILTVVRDSHHYDLDKSAASAEYILRKLLYTVGNNYLCK